MIYFVQRRRLITSPILQSLFFIERERERLSKERCTFCQFMKSGSPPQAIELHQSQPMKLRHEEESLAASQENLHVGFLWTVACAIEYHIQAVPVIEVILHDA